MQDTLSEGWDQEGKESIEEFDSYRLTFRPANADLVRRVLSEHINPTDRIIEIGSGLGELVNLVPEYESHIQQTELSQETLAHNKRLNPGSNIKKANVYDLPFPDNSFDVALGFSVFDTLLYLDKAFAELSRVLSAKGKFIHFLDLCASPNTLFELYKDSGKIPFPWMQFNEKFKKYEPIGIQLVEQRYLEAVKDIFHPELRFWADLYVENPIQMFLVGCNPKFISILELASSVVETSGINAEKLRFNETFKNRIEATLDNMNYNIIKSGNADGIAIIRNSIPFSYLGKEVNVILNDVGYILFFNNHCAFCAIVTYNVERIFC